METTPRSESSSSPEMVMIEIPAKQALLMHIQSLQDALAKRNERIEQLEARIEAGDESPLIEQARAKGYTAGWKACVDRLTEITHTTALNLRDIRKDALSIYYDERREALMPNLGADPTIPISGSSGSDSENTMKEESK